MYKQLGLGGGRQIAALFVAGSVGVVMAGCNSSSSSSSGSAGNGGDDASSVELQLDDQQVMASQVTLSEADGADQLRDLAFVVSGQDDAMPEILADGIWDYIELFDDGDEANAEAVIGAAKISAASEESEVVQCPGGGEVIITRWSDVEEKDAWASIDYEASAQFNDCADEEQAFGAFVVNGALEVSGRMKTWADEPRTDTELELFFDTELTDAASGERIYALHQRSSTDWEETQEQGSWVSTQHERIPVMELVVGDDYFAARDMEVVLIDDGVKERTTEELSGDFGSSILGGYVFVDTDKALTYGYHDEADDCPSAGRLTLTGAEGTSGVIAYGVDASGYAVVTEIGSSVEGFESCEAFNRSLIGE